MIGNITASPLLVLQSFLICQGLDSRLLAARNLSSLYAKECRYSWTNYLEKRKAYLKINCLDQRNVTSPGRQTTFSSVGHWQGSKRSKESGVWEKIHEVAVGRDWRYQSTNRSWLENLCCFSPRPVCPRYFKHISAGRGVHFLEGGGGGVWSTFWGKIGSLQ